MAAITTVARGLRFPEGPIAMLDGSVVLETGAVETLYTHSDQGQLRGPNDLVFDAHGGFWFTDFGKTRRHDMDRGCVCYAKADGSTCREVIRAMITPKGVGLSPDGPRLY